MYVIISNNQIIGEPKATIYELLDAHLNIYIKENNKNIFFIDVEFLGEVKELPWHFGGTWDSEKIKKDVFDFQYKRVCKLFNISIKELLC